MSIYPVSNVGEIGIIRDRQPHELPANAWSDGKNFRFDYGFAEKFLGHLEVFGTPSVTPYAAFPVATNSLYFWIFPGLQKVYAYDGNVHNNITRQTAAVDVNYTGTSDNIWTGGVLGGIPILNNGVDVPQMWLPPQTSQRLAALDTWPANTYCEVMRTYKNFLVACNILKPAGRFPTTLKWSHPADPGTVPVTWDETDPIHDAGEYTFSDSSDWLVDTLQMRDVNIVYKESSVWGMQFIGGTDIFRFTKIFNTWGAAGKNCIAEFVEGQHVVLTQGDVVVHDGQTVKSILSGKVRRWLFSNMNLSSVQHNQVVVNNARDEVWVCVALEGSTVPNAAIIWNFVTGAIGVRDLPTVTAVASGIVNVTATGDLWSSDSITWDTGSEAWGERLYAPAVPSLLLVSAANNRTYKSGITTDFNNTPMEAYIERTGIGIPMKQGQPPDFTSMKFIRNIWPRIEGTNGGVVNVQLGLQNEIDGAVTWGVKNPFTIGTSRKIDVLGSTRLLAVRFSSDTSVDWRIHGYELDVEFAGNF